MVWGDVGRVFRPSVMLATWMAWPVGYPCSEDQTGGDVHFQNSLVMCDMFFSRSLVLFSEES